MKPETTSQPSHVQKTGDRIEVEYQRTGEDYAAWLLHVWDKSITRSSQSMPARLGRLLVFAVLCVIALLFVFLLFLGWNAFYNQNKNFLPLLSGLFLLAVLFVVLQRGVGPKSYSRSLARRAAIRQFRLQTKRIQPVRERVILSPDEVIETCLDLRGKLEWVIDWKVFDSIELGQQHAFFFTQTNAVLVVPQRAFPDERAFLDFVETAWAYHLRVRENSSAAEQASSSDPQTKPAEARITTSLDDRIMS